MRTRNDVEVAECHNCGHQCPADRYTHKQYTKPSVLLHFCSEDCLADYEENMYTEADDN